MAREVTILRWCDNEDYDLHGAERAVATTEFVVTINGRGPILLDLCTPCAEMFAPVEAVMERGVPWEPSMTEDPEVQSRTCPECGMVSATRTALGQHLRKIHSKGLKDYKN